MPAFLKGTAGGGEKDTESGAASSDGRYCATKVITGTSLSPSLLSVFALNCLPVSTVCLSQLSACLNCLPVSTVCPVVSTNPMLFPSLLETAHFSLGTGRPACTLDVVLDINTVTGCIEEYRVAPGVLSDVVGLKFSQVEGILNSGPLHSSSSTTQPDSSQQQQQCDENETGGGGFEATQRRMLSALHDVALARRRYREAGGAQSLNLPRGNVKVIFPRRSLGSPYDIMPAPGVLSSTEMHRYVLFAFNSVCLQLSSVFASVCPQLLSAL